MKVIVSKQFIVLLQILSMKWIVRYRMMKIWQHKPNMNFTILIATTIESDRNDQGKYHLNSASGTPLFIT